MSFRLTSSTPTSVSFELIDRPLSIANAIRRTCLSEVPITAIDRDSVSFRLEENNVNDSSFHDEFLAHRLSFIRLNTSKYDLAHSAVTISICDPEDNDLPFVNVSDDVQDFTTKQLVITDSKSGRKVKHDDVFLSEALLTRLKPSQRLKASMEINCRAVREAELPARYNYQPCRVKFFYKYPKNSPEVLDDQLRYEGHGSKVPKVICMEVIAFGIGDPSPGKIVSDALKVIRDKVANVQSDLTSGPEGEVTTNISVSEDSILPGGTTFNIRNEDHTLGHLLTQKIRQIQDASPSTDHYVAYQKAHPLENVLVLKVRNDVLCLKLSAADTLLEACRQLDNDFSTLTKEWDKALGKLRQSKS